MLPCQELGRRHQGCLRTGLDSGRHGEEGDDGLARADIALQQTQHAVLAGKIRVDLGEREILARVSLKGRLRRIALRSSPAALSLPPALRRSRWRWWRRQLIGEQLVIGKPRAGGRGEVEIAGGLRLMHPRERFGEARPRLLRAPGGIDPFGELRQPLESLGNRFPQRRIGAPRPSADRRVPSEAVTRRLRYRPARHGPDVAFAASRHRIRVCGDEPAAPLWQQPLQIGCVSLEIDELQRAGLILD